MRSIAFQLPEYLIYLISNAFQLLRGLPPIVGNSARHRHVTGTLGTQAQGRTPLGRLLVDSFLPLLEPSIVNDIRELFMNLLRESVDFWLDC